MIKISVWVLVCSVAQLTLHFAKVFQMRFLGSPVIIKCDGQRNGFLCQHKKSEVVSLIYEFRYLKTMLFGYISKMPPTDVVVDFL